MVSGNDPKGDLGHHPAWVIGHDRAWVIGHDREVIPTLRTFRIALVRTVFRLFH